MDELLTKIEDGVGTITINRPFAQNAMPGRLWQQMGDILRQMEGDSDVRVVVITGAGDHFCSGGDVKEFSTTLGMTDQERAIHWTSTADRSNSMFLVIERMAKPVIASARGVVAGGGLAIVAAADLAIASETCRFIVAQIRVGVIPDSAASYNLLRNIGPKRAKQLCFLGDEFTAETAMDYDLVNWVVANDELEAKTAEIAKRLAKAPRVALGLTKAAINKAHHIPLTEHLNQESVDVGAVVSQPDYLERVNAFMNRVRK